jgi:hypothetical protein
MEHRTFRSWGSSVNGQIESNAGEAHSLADAPEGVGRTEGILEMFLSQSRGVDGREHLSRETERWLSGLRSQMPAHFTVHDDAFSHRATQMMGVVAFARRNQIFLGEFPAVDRELILRHELVHLAQMELAIRSDCVVSAVAVEQEAHVVSALPIGRSVRCGAHPDDVHPFFWFVAIGVGLYVLLRPNAANAPGLSTPTVRSTPPTQIVAEALCFFVVPGGAMGLGARLGLGFLGRTAFAGAVANVSMRAVGDVGRGSASPPLMYVFDATTGAVIGFVVPGGVRLIGQAGTQAFDRLATYGLRTADIAITAELAERAAQAPLTADVARKFLQSRGLAGKVSQWWLDRRGLIMLYRGQEIATDRILSPLARAQGVAASETLVARLRSFGMTSEEIAGYTARWHTQGVPPFAAPPGMAGVPLGSVGIPTTRIPGIASAFGDEGIIYMIRVPKSLAVKPMGWQGLQLENELVILNQVPPGAIVQAIPASRVAPLMVDANGLLVPGS